MCGIFGCFHKKELNFSIEIFNKINNFLKHRGPDNSGISKHSLNNYVIKFGHKRLSILGLNEQGNQPMMSSTHRYEIIYNGEVYNHNLLRKKIRDKANISWRGTCDTETLLELFENFEIKEILNMIEGMFAFAVYDKKEKKIILSRDRSGEKPLYIATSENFLGFSSDISTLVAIPTFKKIISKRSLALYLRHNYIPSPYTIYENCFKLPPAKFIVFDLNFFKTKKYLNFEDLINSRGVNYHSYWYLNHISKNNKKIFNNLNDNEIINKVEFAIENSVQNQLISDVPLGAFLSGGIDSSLIVSIMQKKQTDTKTFTIGFEYEKHDESFYANQISKQLGTKHVSYTCSNKDVLDIIPNLGKAFTEPFADSSQLPTMLVSKIASNYVKVVLSGDGGDELFCGYNRYILANKYWKYINIIPKSVRNIFIKLLLFYPQNLLNKFFEYLLVNKFSGSTDTRIEKILLKLSQIDDKFSFYDSLTSEWTEKSGIMSEIPSNNTKYQFLFDKTSNLLFPEAMMHTDFSTYLPDDILCKVDRSSMYYSLETRSPYLNKDLINMAYSLPLNFKIKHGDSKWILKKILGKYISPNLINRPKHGFGVPISEWMRLELKDWVNDLLSKKVCEKHNFFNYNIIQKTKNEHFSGIFNHEHKLWSLVQFNHWYLENYPVV